MAITDEGEMTPGSMSVESNGTKVTFPGRQLSMLGAHPEMDEHTKMVEDAVKDLASAIIDSGLDGEFATKLKLKKQFFTDRGVVMDVTLTITFAAKPAKEEE